MPEKSAGLSSPPGQRRPRRRIAGFAAALTTVGLLALPASSLAATFTVNTTADNAPTAGECSGAAGDCSLRQAIDAANHTSTDDTITVPAGDYKLTITGANETNDLTGDLDVNKASGTLSIIGTAGARSTTIDATGLGDRVLQLVQGTLAIKGLTITGGTTPAGEQGGGIFNSGGTISVIDSILQGNSSAGSSSADGGGIANSSLVTSSQPTMTLSGDTITGNTAGEYGGGVDIDNGSALIENTTITGNSSAEDGGGVDTDTGGTVQFTNDTIDANTAQGTGTGGGVYVTGSNLQFADTIVANNTSGSASTLDCSSKPTDQGHNLDSTGTCFTPSSTNGDINANPKLGPLQNNGGPTDTQALLDGSPAINAGDNSTCATIDQRGVSRPQPAGGTCDIGAYEATAPAAVTLRARHVTETSATLNGTVNPENLATTYHFEFGRTKSYGKNTPSLSAGSGNKAIAVLARLSGLKPGTVYHFRLVATNSVGTTYGGDRTFRTAAFKGAYAPAQTDRVSTSGTTHVRVVCPSGSDKRCSGKLILSDHGTVIATVRIRIGSGRSERVKVHLTSHGLALVNAAGRLKVKAIVKSHDVTGASKTRTGTVTLAASAPSFTG
jgi:hypothetical protein